MRNYLKNNRYAWLIVLLTLCVVQWAKAAEEGEVNVQEIVFSHIQDAYTWHITEWNDKEIAIPLPIIVKGEEGWKVFLSSRLHHGESYEGFYLAQDGDHAGKVVTRNSAGEEVRPLDISLTKNVCGLFISSGLLILIILQTARWYKKHPNEVPRGFTGMIEVVVTYIEDDVIKNSIGKEYYKPYSSFLQTVFFFILINNLIGIIPIFPGGANVTGNIAITFVLAVCTFIAVNVFAGTKAYWKDIFWPKVPIYLKLPLPIMVAHHAIRGVLWRIHQAVRLDDPSVREHYGRAHDHPRLDLLDIHHRVDGRGRQYGHDVGFHRVLRIHELFGAVRRLLASLYFHLAVRQLYRVSEGEGLNSLSYQLNYKNKIKNKSLCYLQSYYKPLEWE